MNDWCDAKPRDKKRQWIRLLPSDEMEEDYELLWKKLLE